MIHKENQTKYGQTKVVQINEIMFSKYDREMYSTHNEGKSVVAERFIKTLKTKTYKYMTSVSKNNNVNKLNDIADEYNNTHHRTIKMKPADVKDNTYIDFDKKVNDKDHPKFKVGDHVRISKYKNIFAKDILQIGLKKLKTRFRGHMLLVILMVKKLLEHYMKKNCKKQIKKYLEQKK